MGREEGRHIQSLSVTPSGSDLTRVCSQRPLTTALGVPRSSSLHPRGLELRDPGSGSGPAHPAGLELRPRLGLLAEQECAPQPGRV